MKFDYIQNFILVCTVIFREFLCFGHYHTLPILRGSEKPGEPCQVEGGIFGRCERVQRCRRKGGIVKRASKIRLCASYNAITYVCCRSPFQVAKELCSSWKSYWRDNEGKCIVTKPLIVGGRQAGVGQFPEMAILGVKVSGGYTWICGGSLISPHYILTAAHCVEQKAEYIVRLGQHDLFYEDKRNVSRVVGPVPLGLYKASDIHQDHRNEAPVEQTIHVEKVILYPKYDRQYHDIALLLLERPVVLTKRVLPACLPTDPREDFMHSKLTVAGWGRTMYNSKSLSPQLRMTEVPVIWSTECSKSIQNESPFLIPKGILKAQMCAGEYGKSFCSGDSGGPLVIQLRKRRSQILCEHTIAGIVSFGPGCERLNVYTRVSWYLDWITGYIAPNLLPKRSKGQRNR